MRRATVNRMRADPADEDAPPPGTAIVRPLRHIRAVRERQALRYADPGDADASRAARAWAWALGECPTAPVTDRPTSVPPSRSDIEAEITEADERRFRGDRENRADGAATILRWLIGDDDHVPVRGENRGELVGGFGDVVRSPAQIASILALARDRQQRAGATGRDLDADPADRRFARQDVRLPRRRGSNARLGPRRPARSAHHSLPPARADHQRPEGRTPPRRGRNRAGHNALDGRPSPAGALRRRRQTQHLLAARGLHPAAGRNDLNFKSGIAE